MTIEQAQPFFAMDVVAYLALFLVLAFVIVVIDRVFFFDSNSSEIEVKTKNKTLAGKLLYFLCFLKFNRNEKYTNRPKIVQWSAEFFPVLLLVFVFRSFIFEPFRIPSNSMMPTLLTGDFVLVNKFSYGINLPIINTELYKTGEPEVGDIIVFRYPNYENNPEYSGADFIKRLIGLPGDELSYSKDKLIINGEEIAYIELDNYLGVESGINMTGFKHLRELLKVNQHDILLDPKRSSRGIPKIKVPEGHYFVMGDNRSRSSDSRFWGFVPQEYVIGRAVGVWMHWDKSLKLDRIGGID
jgi:signal peptidase I